MWANERNNHRDLGSQRNETSKSDDWTNHLCGLDLEVLLWKSNHIINSYHHIALYIRIVCRLKHTRHQKYKPQIYYKYSSFLPHISTHKMHIYKCSPVQTENGKTLRALTMCIVMLVDMSSRLIRLLAIFFFWLLCPKTFLMPKTPLNLQNLSIMSMLLTPILLMSNTDNVANTIGRIDGITEISGSRIIEEYPKLS